MCMVVVLTTRGCNSCVLLAEFYILQRQPLHHWWNVISTCVSFYLCISLCIGICIHMCIFCTFSKYYILSRQPRAVTEKV